MPGGGSPGAKERRREAAALERQLACFAGSNHSPYVRRSNLLTTLKSMIRDEEGATMVEYGLLLALIALAALIAVKGVGTGLTTLFNNVATSL